MPDQVVTQHIAQTGPSYIELISTVAGLIFTALTGVVVWLAKGVMKRVEQNSEAFTNIQLGLQDTRKDIQSLLEKFSVMLAQVNKINSIETQIALVEQELKSVKLDLEKYRELLNKVKEDVLRNNRQSYFKDNQDG